MADKDSAEITPLDFLADMAAGQCIRCGMLGTAWCFSPYHHLGYPEEIISIFILCQPCRVAWPIGVTSEELAMFDAKRIVARAELEGYEMTAWNIASWVSESFTREALRRGLA